MPGARGEGEGLNTGASVARVLGPAALLAGLALTAFAVREIGRALRRRSRWARAQGVVLDTATVESSSDSVVYRVQVRFAGPRGDVTFWNRSASNAGGRVGSTVPVLYDPHDPNQAVVAGGAHGDVGPNVLWLGVGLVFVAVGAAVSWSVWS